MGMNSLEDLYFDHLKDIYNSEHQIMKALPRMSKKAASPELKRAFERHIQYTKAQIVRLEKVFEKMQKSPLGKKCLGMEGLLQEGEEIMAEEMDPMIKDSALIGATQRVKHYELSAYETLVAFARWVGDDEAVSLFKQTLNEETNADEILTKIATEGINQAALLR